MRVCEIITRGVEQQIAFVLGRGRPRTRHEFERRLLELLGRQVPPAGPAARDGRPATLADRVAGVRAAGEGLLALVRECYDRAQAEVGLTLGRRFGRWWSASASTPAELARVRRACAGPGGRWPGKGYRPGKDSPLSERLFRVIRPGAPAGASEGWWADLAGDVPRASGLEGFGERSSGGSSVVPPIPPAAGPRGRAPRRRRYWAGITSSGSPARSATTGGPVVRESRRGRSRGPGAG